MYSESQTSSEDLRQLGASSSSEVSPPIDSPMGAKSGHKRRPSLKRKTQEFLKRSNSGVLPPLDMIIPGGRTSSMDEHELGYRSDNSDGESDDLEALQLRVQELSSSPSLRAESGRPVARLKRSLSVKFRSSNKVSEPPPPAPAVPVDDTLHKALAQNVNLKTFTKLLKRATHIDQVDAKGQSSLHLCCSRGLIEFIKLLLKRGADVNLKDNMGYTPLHCAAVERQLASCQLLLESKVIDVNLTNREESNILHYLARIPVDESDIVEYRRILDTLIEKGIDPNRGNTHKEAPIHFACMKSNVQSVALLLERGADCNLPTA